MTRLSEVIRQARQAKGLTREDLAVRLQCSVLTIMRWENGRSRPIRAFQIRLEEELGVDLGEWKSAATGILKDDR